MEDRDHEVFCMIMQYEENVVELADAYGIDLDDAKSVLDIHSGDMDAAEVFLDSLSRTERTTTTYEEVYSFFIN